MCPAPSSKPTTPKTLMQQCKKMDNEMGLFVFNTVQCRPWLKTLMIILTLTVDEIVAMPLPFFVGVYLYNFGSDEATQICGRRLIRLMGDVGAVALMEQGCKFVFQRPRPNWRKPNLYYCMPCEWWSFPSGHAMRAGFLGCVICSEVSPFRSITDDWGDMLGPLVFCWVIACCVSRVALGKHFPADVVAGVCVGACIGKSGFPISPAMGVERTVLGTIFTIESIIQSTVPKYRKLIPGHWTLALVCTWFWVTFTTAL